MADSPPAAYPVGVLSTLTPINRYRDRSEAGHALARRLTAHAGRDDTLILALPRGGVPVAAEIARVLRLPLDVFVVRKIGHPANPEFAVGAIASGGVQLLDETLIANERLSPATIAQTVARETEELARRETLYRGNRPRPDFAGRRLLLVDDGVATGYTLRVAVLALQRLQPAFLGIAIPVGAPDTCAELATAVDELVCPVQPNPFHAVGLWYDHFPPVSDEEVRERLAQASPPSAADGRE